MSAAYISNSVQYMWNQVLKGGQNEDLIDYAADARACYHSS